MDKYAIVLAAGKGTRMKSIREDVSKVSFPVLGRAMVEWVLESLKSLELTKIVTVVGFGGKTSEALAKPYGEVVWQREQKGTGHAVMMAAPLLEDKEGVTLICCGDTPLLTSKTLEALLSSHELHHNDLTLLTANVDDPRGYGRIIKKNGRVVRIVEQKDCTPDIDAIHEINAGVYAFDNRELFHYLKRITPNNAAGEYYLTDVIGMFVEDGLKVSSFSIADVSETMGVNDRYQLSIASKAMQRRINKRWMIHGVTFEDPESAFIGPDVKLSRDTVIRPNVHVLGKSYVGHENIIGPNTYLENVHIGERNVIEYSHLVDTVVEDDAHLGPFLRTRGGTKIHSKAALGNFNELKNVDFGENSRCLHLSYLGDTTVGKDVNVGCGTITANFDGEAKYESEIKDGAFIGCGSVLVSPVTVNEKGFVAAGSTITDDVPAGSLSIARARQENKPGRSPLEKKEK